MRPALQFLTGVTPELLAENEAWLVAAGAYSPQTVEFMFCFQSYVVRTPHHTVLVDSCIGNHKPRPTRGSWHLKNDEPVHGRPARGGPYRRRHRHRHVHAPARRSRRMEHPARERTLGAHLPQRALPRSPARSIATGSSSTRKRRSSALPTACCRSSKRGARSSWTAPARWTTTYASCPRRDTRPIISRCASVAVATLQSCPATSCTRHCRRAIRSSVHASTSTRRSRARRDASSSSNTSKRTRCAAPHTFLRPPSAASSAGATHSGSGP